MDESYFPVNLGVPLCLSWYLLEGLSFIQHRQDRKEGRGQRSQSKTDKGDGWTTRKWEGKTTDVNCWWSYKRSTLIAETRKFSSISCDYLKKYTLQQLENLELTPSFVMHSILFLFNSKVRSTLSFCVVTSGSCFGSVRSRRSCGFLLVILWCSFGPCGC